jgi:hypothetical protein
VVRSLPIYGRKKISGKYILIESDDWGLEMTHNNAALEFLASKYGRESFTRWTTDSLETPNDLKQLYQLLFLYKDSFDKPPVITANFITHNIDYSKRDAIHFRPISEGFSTGFESPLDLYKEGIAQRYIVPQLHGFSHYHLEVLNQLFQSDEGQELYAQKALPAYFTIKNKRKVYIQNWQMKWPLSPRYLKKYIQLAHDEFKKYFGFPSVSIIPPTYAFNPANYNILKQEGISAMQGANVLVDGDGKLIFNLWNRKKRGIHALARICRLDPDTHTISVMPAPVLSN